MRGGIVEIGVGVSGMEVDRWRLLIVTEMSETLMEVSDMVEVNSKAGGNELV